tara:strand:+ start:1457 stop:1648 length:192 start_codon:yes stop_codon:yes gene_type:complete
MIQWFINLISWGKSYEQSWWGNVNEANSWGIVYPYDAEGSNLTADSFLVRVSNFFLTADKTKY